MRPRNQILAILLCSLLLRLGAAYWWHGIAQAEGRFFRFGDSDGYWVLANHIARGEPYEYGGPESRIFRAPLYPLFLAPFTQIPNVSLGILFARFAGAILGTCSVGAAMWIAFRIHSFRACLMAGILVAVYPGAIGMSVLILSESIFVPLLLISMAVAVRIEASLKDALGRAGPRTVNNLGWLIVGCLQGLATLARPSWLLFPIAMVFSLIGPHPYRGSLVRRILWLTLGMCIALFPWWLRNYWITSRFVASTLQVGASLYDGLHRGATGGSDEGMEFAARESLALQKEESKSALQLPSTFEFRLNQRLQKLAIQWSVRNPSAVAKLAVLKFFRTWTPWPSAEQLSNLPLRIGEAVCYLIILCLGVFGLQRVEKLGMATTMLWLPLPYFATLHMIFVGSVRYRQPAIVCFAILAGVGAAHLLPKNTSK